MALYIDADEFSTGNFTSNKVYPRKNNDTSLDNFYTVKNNSTTIFLGGENENFSYTFNALSWRKGVQINNSFFSTLDSCTDEWGNPSVTEGFYAANDKLEINKGGRKVFSTGNSMPHIYAVKKGTVSFPARQPLLTDSNVQEDTIILSSGLLTNTTFILVEAEYSEPSHLVGYKLNFNGTSSPVSVQLGFPNGAEIWVAHSLLDFFVDDLGRLVVSNRWFNQSDGGQIIPPIQFQYTCYLGLYN